jgi:hypothetical protein
MKADKRTVAAVASATAWRWRHACAFEPDWSDPSIPLHTLLSSPLVQSCLQDPAMSDSILLPSLPTTSSSSQPYSPSSVASFPVFGITYP